ncbi:hypothetical protein FJR45_00355 [Sulfurimonas sediminis]|uniref:Uncharacterized protein n=1 Tax=Sulfurimonas sediminis TaxID=2590020 RepID=A0A7M1AYC9_9BACT|nr:hypothetical protein [Sulfurimonas sediminis]QOP42487.1 hypothetical protein FJR45_00355 [Sulfurimonas sediminis]
MKLISGAECVRRLRQAGVYKGKESYFSQLVQKGVIPYHQKEASPKKWYVLDEVKQALKDWEDPSRDAQREANEAKRRELAISQKINELESTLLANIESFKSVKTLNADDFNLDDLEDMTQEEFKQELKEINSSNMLISEMATDYFRELSEKGHTGNTYLVLASEAVEFFQKWLMLDESIEEFYGVTKK